MAASIISPTKLTRVAIMESSNSTASDPGQTDEKARILIVDDREDKRMAMEAILADLDQHIVKASSGRDALRILMHQTFAVILLDVNMPSMDGFETALLIRQRRNLEHVPIIFVTGISDTETHVSRGYSLGAVDYILTPVVPEILRAKASVFVELFKITEQVKRQAEHLRLAHDELEARVKQRTAELAIVNESLQEEIAERQRAEDNIRKLNSELEQRVQERTGELAAANQELETFTYSIAHDLRAPLRQIHGYAQILDSEFVSALPIEAQQYFKRIEQRSQNMEQMVDDLLRLSDVAKQDINYQKVDLGQLIKEVLGELESEMKDRQINWQLGPLPTVSCSPGLMKQVFTNLLSNSIKYTRPRAKAIIEVGQVMHDGKSAIYVRDNGVGFNMEYAGRLFGVFQRFHKAEDFEGTGVGLALAARIIRKHSGRIWAEAQVDKGAAFYFTLG